VSAAALTGLSKPQESLPSKFFYDARGSALFNYIPRLDEYYPTRNAAYNDSRGVTAAFNLNVRARINRELGADIDLGGFAHRAFYARALGRVEMHLVSRRRQTVHIDEHAIDFAEGESIHTENSYKYSVEEFRDVAIAAGFALRSVWTDARDLFRIHHLEAR
jgi:uncharacterized SAM-dependent methyltransferase